MKTYIPCYNVEGRMTRPTSGLLGYLRLLMKDKTILSLSRSAISGVILGARGVMIVTYDSDIYQLVGSSVLKEYVAKKFRQACPALIKRANYRVPGHDKTWLEEHQEKFFAKHK